MQIELLDLPKIPSIKSPLGYPGGKRRSWNLLSEHLPRNLTHLVSPFMGGGSIELACTGKNIRVQGSDNFEPLINFWQNFLDDSKAVIDLVCSMYPLTFEQRLYYHSVKLEKNSAHPDGSIITDLERAAIYLCVNKQSFRNWTFAARPSRYEVPVTIESFRKWETWQNAYLEVTCSDYVPIIENADGRFMYLDPPYVGKEEYYGVYEDESEFDHYYLAELLHKTSSKWMMSYGDHELIRKLYKKFTILEPKWKYTVRRNSDSTSQELLILNL